MATGVSDAVRDALGQVLRESIKQVGDVNGHSKRSPLSGARGLATGAGLAAIAPLAKKGVDAVRSNGGLPTPGAALSSAASKAGDKVGGNLKDVASSKVEEAGGAGGLMKEAASSLLPGGGDGGGGSGMPGVGKGRRMPVQQAVDVAVPLETAYNQWTQFEDWPEFMHRVVRVSQDDDCTVKFATKIWGKTKEFQAKIETQRPDQRIKWRVDEGITHSGVVTFHELAENLTRIEVNLDVDPGSLIEKAARGMRHVKRAVRADLARFKAFVEMQELETGAWRGVIEDGELVEPHDDSYDEERDYSEIEHSDEDDGDEADDGEDDGREEDQPRSRSAATSASRSSRTAGSSRPSGSSKPKSSSSRSSGSSKPRSGSSRSSGSSKPRSGSSRSSGSSKPKSSSSSSSGSSKSSSSRSRGTSKSSSSSSSGSNRRSGGSRSKSASGSGGTRSRGGAKTKSGGSSSKRSGSTARRKTSSRS
jgi:uncharacterized membrane protein